MAQFSLSLINKHGTIVLTDYDTLVGKTAGLTFDEHLNLNVDGSTLDFSMLKYLYEGSRKVVNTPTVSITYGSIIKCLHNGHRYDFAITDINYQFLAENLQLNFSAQDYFQFETSKIGIGYTITGDTTDPSYFGAKPIDAWAHQIIQENNLRWGYIPINQANREWINISLTDAQKQYVFNTGVDAEEYWKNTQEEYTLNQWVSFECSDSSAYNALKQLATENELMIMVDYSNHNFWFAPTHNIIFNGYYFNPNNNLQQFAVKGSAQNLVTVLNVTGPKDINDQEITLVPSLPNEVMAWILSDDWLETKYYPNLYADHTNDMQFNREVAYTPWLENKLIDYSFFQSNHLLLPIEVAQIQEMLYNQLRIINGRLIVQQKQYLTRYGEQYAQDNQNIINAEGINAGLMGDIAGIEQLFFSDKPACFAVADQNGSPWLYWPEGYSLYTTQYGQVTRESLQPDGIYYNKLFCPELGQSRYETCTLQTVDQSLLFPFNLTIGGYTYGIWWFTTSSDNKVLQYKGSSAGLSTSIPTSKQFDLAYPSWCSLFQVTITRVYGGAPLIGQIRIDSDTTQARGYSTSTGQWGQWTKITEQSVNVYNFCTIKRVGQSLSIQSDFEFSAISFKILNGNGNNVSWSYGQRTISGSIQITEGQVSYRPGLTSDDRLYINDSNVAAPYTFTDSSQIVNIGIKTIVADSGQAPIQHIQALVGDLEFYGQSDSSESITNYCYLKLDDHDKTFSGPYLFQQLRNAYKFTTLSSEHDTDHSTTMIDILNQLCGTQDGYAQTFSKNAFEFLNLWNQYYEPYLLGQGILKLQDVSVDANAVHDWIASGDPYYTSSLDTFDSNDIDFLMNAIKPKSNQLLRTEVIVYLQSIITALTEKWNNCYAAAVGLGIWWPSDWNNSKTLMKIDRDSDQITHQQTLYKLLSPLIFDDRYLQASMTNLMPNLNLFPVITLASPYINSNFPKGEVVVIYASESYAPIRISGQLEVDDDVTDINQPPMLLTDGVRILVNGCTFYFKLQYNNSQFQLTLVAQDLQRITTNRSVNLTLTTQSYEVLQPISQLYKTYEFFDNNKNTYIPLLPVSDNTELRPYLINDSNADAANTFCQAWTFHQDIADQLRLQATIHHQYVWRAQPNMNNVIIPAMILGLPLTDTFAPDNYRANPNRFLIYTVARQTLYDTSTYYKMLSKHNTCWQTLYQNYPGIFRESTYNNTTAVDSQELYVAAKAQLDNLSRPSFEYTLTGMDIYMYNSDFIPTKLHLGEQIRIDYQDPDQLTDTLNAALREPLYITGISHALRNDGDYQFTVTTRTATDSMVQRFAQLLNFGR